VVSSFPRHLVPAWELATQISTKRYVISRGCLTGSILTVKKTCSLTRSDLKFWWVAALAALLSSSDSPPEVRVE
jgi:hypothetical protein